MLPEYNISLAHNALLIISMWSEAREAVCQGLPVSGRAGGPGPSPLAAVLRHLRYPHHLSRVPTSLCSHSRLVSKRSHKWQLWVRWWLRDSWFSCPVGATQTGKLVPAKPEAGLGLGGVGNVQAGEPSPAFQKVGCGHHLALSKQRTGLLRAG